MKLAESAPAYCSACFQAGSDKRYIDFEAAYDGPVMEGVSHKIPIDDLVLCEDCLNAAFAVLDLQGLRPEIERLEAENTTLELEVASMRRQLGAARVIRAEQRTYTRKKKVKANG